MSDRERNKELSIYYLANAGIYFTDGNTGLLIDGLFDAWPGFDGLPYELEEKIMKKEVPFQNLSHLFFTHEHLDHCSHEKLQQFSDGCPDIPVYRPSERNNLVISIPVTCRISVTGFSTRHLLDASPKIPHDLFLLDWEDSHFFISGDADPVSAAKQFPENLLESHAGQIDMAFINPFWLSLTPGRRFLEQLKPKRIFVYHLPLIAEDTMRYGEVLERGIKRCQGIRVEKAERFLQKIKML
ncbi:MAG: hypothetical protein MR487_09315 [Lachnospiraceae bacterium]|nr:hypothetical protein [Lachnospiraceae bacterium]